MKIDLRKCSFGTAIIASLYAIFRIVMQCCRWSGIYFWLHHPIRGHIVGHGIDMLFDLSITFFLFALWANRTHLPKTTAKWNYFRYLLIFALAYVLIFQTQMTYYYPMYCSRIFYHTLWILPIIYVIALWMFYAQVRATTGTEVNTYCLNNTRSSCIIFVPILLILSVLVGVVLFSLWYKDPTIWLDRWHWRIPMIIKAIGEVIMILYLTIKNN